MTTKEFQERSPLRIFISYFKPHKGLFFLDLTCALVICLIDLAFPYVSRMCMNDLLPAKLYNTFFTVMAIIFVAFLLRAVMYFIICYLGHTFGILVEADIRESLFRHLQEMGFDFYDQNRTGQLMSRMTNDLFELTELAHHGPEDIFISSVTIVGAIIIMATIEWRLALVVAIIIPIFIFVVMQRRRKMSAASRAVKVKTASINSELESSLSGIRTAKAFANEGMEIDKFCHSNDQFKTSKRMFHKEMGIFNASMEFFMCVMSAAVIAVGGYLIMKGRMNYIDLFTFSLYISTFISPIRKLANFAELFTSGFAGLTRFVEIMRTEPSLKDKPDAKELSRAEGYIDIENVEFSYPDEKNVPVLKGITFNVNKGETIAVVGPSGGGKTTLCQLVPRFYDVSAGKIKIDGTDVRDISQKSLRQNIGIVQQDIFLFADTIFENIRYGRPDATLEEVKEAARRAEIYDDIMAMPAGFDTYVGERGTLLSGGQKQRVSIARIFLKNPPILILDEATSALDSVTEAKIQKAFNELAKGRTTLIIAHRLSTVRNASHILVVRDGLISEHGTHEELLAKNGDYAELYRTQNLGGDKKDI